MTIILSIFQWLGIKGTVLLGLLMLVGGYCVMLRVQNGHLARKTADQEQALKIQASTIEAQNAAVASWQKAAESNAALARIAQHDAAVIALNGKAERENLRRDLKFTGNCAADVGTAAKRIGQAYRNHP
jgi:hypothetical protein